MQIDLTRINIDKYLDWYFQLTIETELIPVFKSRIGRYAVTAYWLHSRHLFNQANKKSLELHDLFMTECKKYQKRLDDIEEHSTPELRKILLIPTLEDWNLIKHCRESFLETSIEEYEKKASGTALSELEFAKRELKKLQEEKEISFLDYYLERSVLPKSESTIITFIADINRIDYAKYLSERITALEAVPADKNLLKWIGKPSQLGFIIGELAQKGYIEAPNLKNGEINYTEFAKQVIDSFNVGTTPATLAKALNPNSESGQISDSAKDEFKIPYLKQIS